MKKNTSKTCSVKVCLANCIHSSKHSKEFINKHKPTCTLDEVTLNALHQCEMFKDASYLKYIKK